MSKSLCRVCRWNIPQEAVCGICVNHYNKGNKSSSTCFIMCSSPHPKWHFCFVPHHYGAKLYHGINSHKTCWWLNAPVEIRPTNSYFFTIPSKGWNLCVFHYHIVGPNSREWFSASTCFACKLPRPFNWPGVETECWPIWLCGMKQQGSFKIFVHGLKWTGFVNPPLLETSYMEVANLKLRLWKEMAKLKFRL